MIIEREYIYHCNDCGNDFDEPGYNEDYESIDVGCGARLRVTDLSYSVCPCCGSDDIEENEDKIVCDYCGKEIEDGDICEKCELENAINFLKLSDMEVREIQNLTGAKDDYELKCELEKIILEQNKE